MEQSSISSDLIRGHIDTIILHSLASGDKYAQQISDFIEETSNFQYKINQATLYSSLKRLETFKHVTAYMNDIDGGRRKFFKITPSGAEFVKENLSSWSYSRSIIDRLIGASSKTENSQYLSNENVVNSTTQNVVTKIVYVEKPVEKTETASIETPKIEPVKDIELEKENPLTQADNFRNILNGLIQTTVTKNVPCDNKVEIDSVLEQNEANLPDNQPKNEEKTAFNDVITDTSYNSQKSNNNGKIDFGDLMIKAAQEGYKIRISSKDSASEKGNVLINKVKFISVLCIYLLSVIEFCLISTIFSGIISKTVLISVVLGLFLIPLLFAIKYFKNPDKKSSKIFKADRILTAMIIIFNLILITLALNFIFNTDFNNTASVIFYTVIPIIAILNGGIYSIFEYLLVKNKKFNT